MLIRKTILSVTALTSLVACGSGGSDSNVDADVEYVTVTDMTSDQENILTSHQIDSTAGTVSSDSGVLDRATDRATIDGLTGDIDATRTTVTLDDGGTITLDTVTTEYVTTYASEPLVGNPTIGVVGVETGTGDVPTTGTASYTGTSAFVIINESAVYDLNGTSQANVNFANDDVDLTFESLSGTRSDGASTPTDVQNVATIYIDDAVISGAGFSGGDARFESTEISTTLTGSQIVTTSGSFYGPDAEEIGGAIFVDDTAGAGSLSLQGIFIAD